MAPDREQAWRKFNELKDKVCTYGKPVVHYGFIPAIIVLGMAYTEPRPALAQLISPV